MKKNRIKKKLCVVFTSIILFAFSIASCSLFTPRKEFEKYLRENGRYCIRMIRSNDKSQITAEAICPNSSRIYIIDGVLSDYLTEKQLKNAVYVYVGDWHKSEIKFEPNYDEEYKKWFVSRSK